MSTYIARYHLKTSNALVVCKQKRLLLSIECFETKIAACQIVRKRKLIHICISWHLLSTICICIRFKTYAKPAELNDGHRLKHCTERNNSTRRSIIRFCLYWFEKCINTVYNMHAIFHYRTISAGSFLGLDSWAGVDLRVGVRPGSLSGRHRVCKRLK